jgi:hypothetical protein
MSKIILKKEKDIQKAAEYAIEKIKIKHINNQFFSEIDLIKEVESDLDKFIKKKNSYCILFLYKVLNVFGYLNIEDVDITYKKYFYERLFLTLKRNVILKEVERLYELYKENKLKFTMGDIEYILQNKELLIYMREKNVYPSAFFSSILNKIENEKIKGFNNYGKGKIKKFKRELKEVI